MRNNYANYTQTLHLTLHLSDFPRVTKCIVYALNYTQTIHKLYIETFQTLHKNYTRKPTPQPYILFFEHESNEWNEREWIVRNERNKRDEQNEHGVTPSSRLVTFSLTSGLGAHLGKTRSAPKKNWERT